jgi:alginate O-acetyltransferase complex protein AlgI
MVFSSVVFIFYFLPVFLACYLTLPFKHAVLLFFSLCFYAYGEVLYTYVMLGSIVLNWAFGILIGTAEGRSRQLALACGVAANLAGLCYFKYLGFFHDIAAAVVPSLVSGPRPDVHLPLGISFFTFHALSYLIDVYRRQVPVERSLVYVAVYITMFPQLVAGPIIRFHDIREELHHRRVTLAMFAAGIQIFIVGLAQKVLIANTVAVPADAVFSLDPATLAAPVAWLGVTCYTLQIFFDFAGYSTMAVGLGLMIGFHFPENFRDPYAATSITDFWRRWHISLSSWFRDYLYIPLGGNRAGPLATYRNLLLVFLLCGLWHGANWTFVVWGLWHGAFLVVERLGLSRIIDTCGVAARHVYVMLVVMVGWVFFRADTLRQALGMLGAMAGQGQPGEDAAVLGQFLTPEVDLALLVGVVAATPLMGHTVRRGIAWLAGACGGGELGRRVADGAYLAAVMVAFLLAVTSLAAGTYNPFIYYRF